MMNYLSWRWAMGVILVTGLTGLSFAVGQQVLRQSAYDPQVQLAEDGAVALAGGAQAQTVASQPTVDMAQSLAPFVVVYDEAGNVVAGSGSLNGMVPKVPAGVLLYAKTHSIDTITWQPAPDVRVATVIKYYAGKNTGYMLAGRSLRLVEDRTEQLLKLAAAAWLVLVGVITVGVFGEYAFFKKRA